MTTQADISKELQKLEISSALVELLTLDMTSFGGTIFHFTNQLNKSGGSISFDGQLYQPMPVQITGWGRNSTGTSAKPTMTVGHLDNLDFKAAVTAYGDLVGARLTRKRTFAKFLDDGDTPNGSAFMGPDKAYVEQKVSQDKKTMVFQLGSIADRMNMKLPRRQVLKDENYLGCNFPGVARTRVNR